MKRVVDGSRYDGESERVWMPRVRSVSRDSSVWALDRQYNKTYRERSRRSEGSLNNARGQWDEQYQYRIS